MYALSCNKIITSEKKMCECNTNKLSKFEFYIVQPQWLSQKQITCTFSSCYCNYYESKRKELRSTNFGLPWKCVFKAKRKRNQKIYFMKIQKNHQNFPFKSKRHHYSTSQIRSCLDFPTYGKRVFRVIATRLNSQTDSHTVSFSHSQTVLVFNFISHLLTLFLMVLLLLKQTDITTATTETINSVMPSTSPDWPFTYLNLSTKNDVSFTKEVNQQSTLKAISPLTNFSSKSWFKQKENNFTDEELLQFALDGLGLQKVPDMKKVNISQEEYAIKYNEYLRRQCKRKKREILHSTILHNAWPNIRSLKNEDMETQRLHFYTFPTKTYSSQDVESEISDFKNEKYKPLKTKRESHIYKFKRRERKSIKSKTKNNTKMLLRFSLEQHEISSIQNSSIVEANIRFLLVYKRKKAKKFQKFCRNEAKKLNADAGTNKQHELQLNIYEKITQEKRIWLDIQKVEEIENAITNNESKSQWLQFDVTKSVQNLFENGLNRNSGKVLKRHLKFEVTCDNCKRLGYSTHILNNEGDHVFEDNHLDKIKPVLNVIAKTPRTNKINRISALSNQTSNHGNKNGNYVFPGSCPAETSSSKKNPRCCRHVMQVAFKEIKGFEFIIQPKTFDAGFCFGRCPTRFNPAHHHAMLQSLVWKQYGSSKAPRPCCAPSKLVELEVLHVDEEDSQKLKVSTWTDMRVVECACS